MLNSGVNPGAARTKLAATLGGTPVIIPIYPSQISPTKKAKVMTPNQSSAAAAPRRSVSTPCEASSASGASSASSLTSCGGPRYAAPNSVASEANAGTKSRGSPRRRRLDHTAQAASGQAGHANQLPVERKYCTFVLSAPCGCEAKVHHCLKISGERT